MDVGGRESRRSDGARPLTRGMGFDAMPRFSPDGERVVFVSDRDGGENLWILSMDLTDTTQLTQGKGESYLSPEWTPDGDYVVATKGSKLWMWHREGGGGVQLVEEPGNLRTVGAAFGADDRFIWFSGRYSQGSLYNNGLDLYQLHVYDRDTGEIAGRSDRWGSGMRPTLSPDGRWLVYATRHVADTGLRIRELATGEERWLAYPVQRDDQESGSSRDLYPGMAFTPDSEAVVAFYGGGLWRIPVDGGAASPIPFQAGVALPLGPVVDFDYPIPDTPTFMAKQIRDAVASPDGRRLAFTVLNDLYVMETPGGTPRRLADDLDAVLQHPTWSPDGEWIAFAAWHDDEGGQLWRVPSVGGSPMQLTTVPALYTRPKWSPDGSRILAERGTARAYEASIQRGNLGEPTDLIWIPADGGEVTVVAPASGLSNFHFTSDPGRIFANGEDGLLSMRWDGTDRREIVNVRGRTSSGGSQGQEASAIFMAPDGDRALAQVVYDLYVVTVPRVGGEVPTIDVADPDRANFPALKLTEVGAQFPVWGADGDTVHWSLGNAHVVYDLTAAEAFADSLEAAREAAGDAPDAGDEEEEREPAYEPREFRVQIPVERDIPRGVVALTGARLVTMNGDEVIERGDILIRDNRIAAVGPSGSLSLPADATVLDMTGKTILPGYVDTHAHLRAAYGFHRAQPWAYAANLAFGVTTTRDPQTGTTDVLSYEDMVRAGRMLGPRIYSTGPGVFSSENVQSLDHARDVMRRYAEYYDTKTIKMYGAGNRQQRQWIIEAARELELMPTTEGGLDLMLNLTMAQDGYAGTEHNLPGVPLYDDVVQLVARSRMATTPTLLVTYGGPWAENFFYAREDVLGDEKLVRFTPFEDLQQRALRDPVTTGGSGPTSTPSPSSPTSWTALRRRGGAEAWEAMASSRVWATTGSSGPWVRDPI
ncbi:MAG: amidohydrolase [Gemmatimonadota bacterium]